MTQFVARFVARALPQALWHLCVAILVTIAPRLALGQEAAPIRLQHVVPTDAGQKCADVAVLSLELIPKQQALTALFTDVSSRQECKDNGLVRAVQYCQAKAQQTAPVAIAAASEILFANRRLNEFLARGKPLAQAAELVAKESNAGERDRLHAQLEAARGEVKTALCKPDTDASERVALTALPNAALGDAVLRGLAQFASARLQAELSRALEKKLSKQLCDNAAKKLFVSTCQVLGVRERAAGPQQSWGLLRAAMAKDLEQLPGAVIDVLVEATGESQQQWAQVASDVLPRVAAVLQAARNGGDVVQLLVGLGKPLAGESLSCEKASDVRCVMFVLSVVAEALAADLSVTPGQLPIYAELVLQKAGTIAPQLSFLIGPKGLEARAAGVLAMRQTLEQIVALLQDERRPESVAAAVIERTAAVVRAAAVVWSGLSENAGECGGDKVTVAQCSVWICGRARAMADVVNHTSNKNYAAALTAAVGLANDLGLAAKLPTWLMTYAGFAAELASAKDADAAQKVIEAAAAPVGSYENKRQHGNVALTASIFPGIGGGLEWLTSDNVTGGNQGQHVGMFAPIGLDLTLGLGKGYSVGLFISALDIGSLVDYRLDEDKVNTENGEAKVESEPEVGFAQTISPGAYVNFGLFDLPLVIGGGVAFVPAYRKLEQTGVAAMSEAVEARSSVFRASLFLAVDVATFPIVP